jgi:Hemerythrin HHE cation binding domain
MDDHETEIDRLIDEHRQMMTIMGKLRRATGEPGSELAGFLDELETALAHHTEREESGLFHFLHEIDVGPEYLGLFEHDHGHLNDLLASARHDLHVVYDLLTSLMWTT